MLVLHGFITSNVPIGVPIEWNVMVVYGAFALFWAHPDVTRARRRLAGARGVPRRSCSSACRWSATSCPARLSFLLAMRYYAGNWAYGVWLFRGDSHRKLDRLVKASRRGSTTSSTRSTIARPSIGLVGKVMGFRLMHLHGRALPVLIPKAVDRLEDYEYVDGEIVAGIVLGWNFGDGHLHRERLLAARPGRSAASRRASCAASSSRRSRSAASTMAYRIVDAATGLFDAGTLDVREMRRRQPWMAA